MDMDIFADSDSDSAFEESSPSTCEEPMEVDPPGDSKDNTATAKTEDEVRPPKRKIFQEVSFPSSHRLDHRHQHEFVGALTLDNKIVIGMAVLGMRAGSIVPKPVFQKGKLRYDVAMLELLNGEPAVYSLKEYYPKRNECFLLDKRVYMNSEVYHYSNPKRFGHVSAVELVADVYVPFLNRIIANVPVTDDNYVLSINSNYWRSSPFVILREKRGRVNDAAYTVSLRDKDGKKLKILASVGATHNKITRIREHRAFSSPIVPGDKVRLVAIHRNCPAEWLGEEGTFAEGEEYVVDDIVLSRLGIRWEATPVPSQSTHRFGHFIGPLNSFQEELDNFKQNPKTIATMVQDLTENAGDKQYLIDAVNKKIAALDQLKADKQKEYAVNLIEAKKALNKVMQVGATVPAFKKIFMEPPKAEAAKEGEEPKKDEKEPLDLEQATIDFLHSMETAMQNIPGPSNGPGFKIVDSVMISMEEEFPSPDKGATSEPSKDSTPSSSDTASGSTDSPTVKRRCPENHFSNPNLEWVDVSDLQDRSLLPMRREVVVGSRLKLLGEYELLTPETYYNRLIPEFEKVTKMTIPHLPSKEGADSMATFNEPVYGDVIMRHSKATVEWFDGTTEHGINPAQLHRARKMNHPTETNVYRNMLLKREKTKKLKVGERELYPTYPPTNEFGLVTKVSQEKMLTVRWFKKEETREDAPYVFQGEEIMSQYDNVKHHLFRIPLGAHVYYPSGDREPTDIYNCVARVSKMNEDGTQTITYLDGTQTNVWPGQAQAIDSIAGVPLGYASEGMMFDLHTIQTNASIQFANLASSSPMSSFPPSISFHQTFEAMKSPVTTLPPIINSDPTKSFRRARCYTTASLESRFIELLKKSGDGYNTTRGINHLAAIFVLLDPKMRTHPWFETNLAPYFENWDTIFAEGTDLKDAYDLVQYTYNGDKSDESRAIKAAIIERHPEYEEKVAELFAPSITGVPLLVKLIYELYKSNSNHSPIAIKIRHSFGDERDHGIVVVFPVSPIKESKAWLDQTILEPDTKTYYSRHKIVFSYICTQQFLNFKVPEGKGVYICHTNAHLMGATFKHIASEYWKKFEAGTQCLVAGTLRNVQMFNDTRIACEYFAEHKSLVETPNPSAEDDFEVVIRQIVRVDESLWKDHYHQAYYSKFNEKIKQEEVKKDKVDRLDLNLEELSEALKFDHNNALAPSSSSNTLPDYFFKGELYPEFAMPRAIVLQVSPNLNTAILTESFLVFQIISQVVDCPVWPEVTIHLHRECANSGTLSSNFALALIILRNKQLLSSPYFNVVEVQNLAEQLKEESFKLKGEYVDRFGLETIRQMRNILFKMCSLSCIKFWTKLNVIEQCFGIHRLLDTVKTILNGGSAEVIPFKDLAKVTEECTDLELREHLASIQLSIAPPPSSTQGTFKTLDAVSSHSYVSTPMREMRRDFVGTVKKEHKLLRENIPEGVHVAAFADRLDLLRAIIMGPVDTPYEGVPFLFDILLGPAYPQEAPRVKYVSLTSVAINPNLYTEGTVCLSLLGTWKGENHTMRWIPGTSNILQVVCSIQVEILMEACPYFNEPGFEARRNSEEGKKAAEQYNGQVLVGATEYFAEIMNSPPSDFADLLRGHSYTAPEYTQRLRAIMDGNLKSAFPIDLNDAVRLVVRRNLDRLETAAKAVQESDPESQPSDNEMPNLTQIFSTDSNKVLTMFSCGNPGSECTDLNSYIYLRRPLG